MRCLARQSFLPLRRLFSTVALQYPAVTLRPYQESCLEACTDALSSGVSRLGVSLPTGSGKTTVFITLLSLVNPPAEYPEAQKSLVIVNSVELALQTAAQTRKLFPHWTVEIEQGTKHRASGLADLTVATWQTLLQPSRLRKFNPKTLKAIIVDEAHHAAAPSYRRILCRFHSAIKGPDSDESDPSLNLERAVPILGFSATFSRHDGLALGSVFERIVYHRDFLEMIKEQWLCNVRFTSIRANIDLTNVTVNSRSGDFNATSLAHVINTGTVNNLVVQTWLDRAAKRKSTLVFCVNLAHVRDLTAAFRNAGVDARYVYSGTPLAERKALLTSFRAGEFPVLLNCAILTEGADIPNIDCIVVARPTRSRNVFAQMIGRGMRLSPGTGKEDCHIIDFVDSLARVPGVASVPSLFGLDPSEVIDDVPLDILEERASKSMDLEQTRTNPDTKDSVPQPKSVTYIDYENPFQLVHESSGAPHIRKLSQFAWVGCGGDIYVLECLGKGFLKIEPIESEEDPQARYAGFYTPAMQLPLHVTRSLKLSPYQRSKRILLASSLADAVKGCDTYAKTQVVTGLMTKGLLRTAGWRSKQASQTQKDFIWKRWQKRAGNSPDERTGSISEARDLSRLTKGEAANIITRLKHGAQIRYDKKAKAERKTVMALEREHKRKMRETVSVGPLST